MSRVHVLGSINCDLVIRVAAHPRGGETVLGGDLAQFPGGKGANQAVAARRAGAQTALIGAVGDDAFGAGMRDFLGREGIDCRGLRVDDTMPTGIALIAVAAGGENTIIVSPGANGGLAADDAEALEAQAGDLVIAQFEVPDAFITAGFVRARACGARTLLNPAPMRPIQPELLGLTDILVLNETELEAASGTGALASDGAILAAAQALAKDGRVVIVTLGARGCLAIAGAETIQVPGERVTALDTTGAGDCFVGYLAAGLAGGIHHVDALSRANRAAAISVTRAGAASSIPHAREFS